MAGTDTLPRSRGSSYGSSTTKFDSKRPSLHRSIPPIMLCVRYAMSGTDKHTAYTASYLRFVRYADLTAIMLRFARRCPLPTYGMLLPERDSEERVKGSLLCPSPR
eukprot:1071339-Rhodomonas_salina.2